MYWKNESFFLLAALTEERIFLYFVVNLKNLMSRKVRLAGRAGTSARNGEGGSVDYIFDAFRAETVTASANHGNTYNIYLYNCHHQGSKSLVRIV